MAKKATITIPGTKVKAPRELVILAGGGIVAALFFMRGREEEEGGIPSGILATEIAQRFASERESVTGAIEDINQRLQDLEGGDPAGLPFFDDPPFSSPAPGGGSSGSSFDRPAPASGTFEQPTTTLFPFVNLTEVEAPREDISLGASDAQIRADFRRGTAYLKRAEAFEKRDVSTTPKYRERTVAELISISKNAVPRPGISSTQQRADTRRGSAYAKRQETPQLRAPKPRAKASIQPIGTRTINQADERFLDNPPAWY